MKKFIEDLNVAVLTTKYILEKKSEILYVYHFEDDGMWQFNGNEEIADDSDYKVVSLEEIINIDPSVLVVSDLPLGYEAFRKTKENDWEIKKSE